MRDNICIGSEDRIPEMDSSCSPDDSARYARPVSNLPSPLSMPPTDTHAI